MLHIASGTDLILLILQRGSDHGKQSESSSNCWYQFWRQHRLIILILANMPEMNWTSLSPPHPPPSEHPNSALPSQGAVCAPISEPFQSQHFCSVHLQEVEASANHHKMILSDGGRCCVWCRSALFLEDCGCPVAGQSVYVSVSVCLRACV